jgi:hypothetical protein
MGSAPQLSRVLRSSSIVRGHNNSGAEAVNIVLIALLCASLDKIIHGENVHKREWHFQRSAPEYRLEPNSYQHLTL